jgi:hypothetical protein
MGWECRHGSGDCNRQERGRLAGPHRLYDQRPGILGLASPGRRGIEQMLDLSLRPNVLYLASIERMAAARRMVDDKPYDYVLGAYLSGLAVESILQAIALRSGAAHDARHSLTKWLSKCPYAVNDALRGSAEWNLLVARWDNVLRYLNFDGLLGYLRDKQFVHGKKGGVESLVRRVATEMIDAADAVHKKGMALWQSSTRS